jgi:hypothetical protein
MTFPRVKLLGLAGSLSLGVGLLLVFSATHGVQPVDSWLVWRYAAYAALSLLFLAAALGFGLAIMRLRSVGASDDMAADERWVFGFGIGVLCFGTLVEVVGFLGLLSRATAVLLPVLGLLMGGKELLGEGRRAVRAMAARRSLTMIDHALSALCVIAVGLLYARIAVPAHAGYDARWYHLPIAEHYAATGSVRAFKEGWILGAYPHLMSYLYTWAFLWPFPNLFDHVELGAHIELGLVLGMLCTLPALARRVTGAARGARALPLVFAFPAIFMYGPQLEADMLAAFFGGLAALGLVRYWQKPERGQGIVLGLCMAGLLTTKLSTAAALVPAGLGVALRVLVPTAGDSWRKRLGPAGWTVAVFLVASASHWLKNWVFYGDPLFPLFVGRLPAHPLTHQGREILKYFWPHEVWRPPGNWAGLKEALEVAFTFAFHPHEFASVGQGWPIFGFLFTCALLALPFTRARAEAWLLAGGVTLGVFVWFWVHHQDRYLQVLLPWMVAVVFVVLRWAWSAGLFARGLAVALVVVQVAWGSDVYFHHAPVASLVALATSSRNPSARREQLDVFRPMSEVGRSLPPNAKVLVHEMHDHLGLQAASVSDFAGWQTGLSYVEGATPAAIADKLHRLGVTHILWKPGTSEGMSSLGADLAFFRYVHRQVKQPRPIGPFLLGDVPSAAPPPSVKADLAYLVGCGHGYATGVYALERLDVRAIDPPPTEEFPRPSAPLSEALLTSGDIDTAAVDTTCGERPAFLTKGVDTAGPDFDLVARRGSFELWVRRRP